MNERIKVLIQQATTRIDPTAHDGACWDFDQEKFAQLIVEECRTVINDVYHKTPLELCGPLLTVDEEIMNHFYGVEKLT
jgi:hypothetical protein